MNTNQYKKLLILWFLPIVFLCLNSFKHTRPEDKNKNMKVFVDELMQKMTINEKIGQLNLLAGYEEIITGAAHKSVIGNNIREGKVGAVMNVKSQSKIRELQRLAVEESRLGIPLLFGMDVIHGYKTVFPIPLGLAASFDMDLIQQSARISAIEASADGICWNFSPMVDISRDPRWGRMAEGVGEDPYLASCIASSFVKGYQGDDLSLNNTIMACVKHFALYGAAEGGRDYNTADMSRIRMFNEYFPPFKAAIEAGVGSVMTAFNEVDGVPASCNQWLMTQVLRETWGFNGFVVTDYTAINEIVKHGLGDLQQASALALKAGVDMDMIGMGYLTTLEKSLRDGLISESQINTACRRILEAKYKLGLFDDPYRYLDPQRPQNEIFTPEHNKIARETAAQTFVLLKNDNQILPLSPKGKIALIGPLADNQLNMAGTWSVAADHRQSITVLEGLINVLSGRAEVSYAKGCNITEDPEMDLRTAVRGIPSIDKNTSPEKLRAEALDLAKKSDIIVAVMGESAEMSGESSSRADITLPGKQRELLEELVKTGKPVVLVLFTGRPLILSWEHEHIPAILNVWFGGTQSGNAIADVIFGSMNPCGKLPVCFPRHLGQIPVYYNHKNTGRPLESEWFKKFRSNYLDVVNEPLYPFGYGLSYTSFSFSPIQLNKYFLKGFDTLYASVTITNTGKYEGAEIAQLYIRDLVGSITRPVKELKGFQKVYLMPGEKKTITFSITPKDLMFYNYNLEFDWEAGEFIIMIGNSSNNVETAKIVWDK